MKTENIKIYCAFCAKSECEVGQIVHGHSASI